MSATKTALKAAKAALDAHKYEEAIEQAHSVTAAEPSNYNANVFLGLAYEKQSRYEESEAAYRTAIKGKDKDALAWQGLVSLYERQTGDKLDSYHDAVLALAGIYMDKDDRDRCQSVLDRYTSDAKKYGSRTQLKHSLEVYLPTGSLYEYLEGRIPHPGQTYSRIADLVEAEEKEKINTEVGQRRTRLGAKIDQVIVEVKREVLEHSQLEDLYGAVVDWTNDDEVRRQYEEKLLQRVYDHLGVLPGPKKATKRAHAQKLAEGMVILKHPFLLAWTIKLEWDDVEDIKDMDVGQLRDHVSLFLEDGRSKVLKGFLESEASPFPKIPIEPKAEEVQDDDGPLSSEEGLILMSEGLEESSTSILSNRIMAQYYLHLEEYESAAATARQGRHRIQVESELSGLSLREASAAIDVSLATALVQYQSPRHHPEARELFEHVLDRKPSSTSALLGIGMILEDQEDYGEAVRFLSRALQRSNEPRIRAEVAWCKVLTGDDTTSLHELESCLPEMEGSDPRTKALRSQTLYRIGRCIWNEDPSFAARKAREGAYARFIAALQADLNNAPAYTSLGVYYADYAKDKKRARKCFQKAFELSSSEVEAAHRLAKSFAKSNEWDPVEVVAQRVIESGKVKGAPGSKKKAISWPFAAMGVVQLNSQEYAKSVVSFQSALRTSPADYNVWLGLGESYHNCGRYVAATKAFEQAQKLENNSENEIVENNWFSNYMLANVKRELGEYDDAITSYQVVLKYRPNEFGVSIALLQSLVESAWHDVELGFFGRAAGKAVEAIQAAHDIVQSCSDTFNLWKAVGDACSVFTSVCTYAGRLPCQTLALLLGNGIEASKIYTSLADIDGVGEEAIEVLSINADELDHVTLSIRAAILAQKRAIYACANDIHAKAVAWYNLGWTEYRAHLCGSEEDKSSPKRKHLNFLKASVQCFKRAIELEAGNAGFWNALGVVTTKLSPKVSQHSFVRSLYLNEKSAQVWTNLGTLYLIQQDYQLANEAFTRAQSTDPDYALAWVGQALLANLLSDPKEARTLFAHAFEISDSSSAIIKRQYAMTVFDHLLLSPPSSQASDLLQPLLALRQLQSQVTGDLAIEHLFSLFAERIGDFGDSVSSLDAVSHKLEAQYESSESPDLLLQFAQVKADLARSQLPTKNFENAAENAETAINLSEEIDQRGQQYSKLRLSAHMTAGLAHYYQAAMDEAIASFRNALEETKGDPDIICLLAQILWAKGGDAERTIAREQLFDCIEKHPRHVGAILLLGAIAVLSDDKDTIEAVTDDLQNLRTRDDLTEQQLSKVGHLLNAMAAFGGSDVAGDEVEETEAKRAIMLAPAKPHGWSQLDAIAEDLYPVEMAVLTATKAIPPHGTLGANDLAKAYVGTRKCDDAQRAVVLAPWMSSAWQALESAL